MIELINISIISFYIFIAIIFFVITISELKRGERLIKTCFAAGFYCIIFALLHAMLECRIINTNLLIITITIGSVIYLLIVLYAAKYVKSTIRYK